MSISACNLIDTSRFVEAEEAYRIDLLDRLVPADTLLKERPTTEHGIDPRRTTTP
jgi:hypothetical protein